VLPEYFGEESERSLDSNHLANKVPSTSAESPPKLSRATSVESDITMDRIKSCTHTRRVYYDGFVVIVSFCVPRLLAFWVGLSWRGGAPTFCFAKLPFDYILAKEEATKRRTRLSFSASPPPKSALVQSGDTHARLCSLIMNNSLNPIIMESVASFFDKIGKEEDKRKLRSLFLSIMLQVVLSACYPHATTKLEAVSQVCILPM
jgi:hypothetical protein